MTGFFSGIRWHQVLWPLLGLLFTVGFFCSVTLLALAVRHRNGWGIAILTAVLLLSYILAQCVMMRIQGSTPVYIRRMLWLMERSDGLPFLLSAALMIGGEILAFSHDLRRSRSRITPMSIKEAMDSLPVGICYCLPGGRVIMANRMMEDFCARATGKELVNGEAFSAGLRGGGLAPGCSLLSAEGSPVITLPDGTAWSLERKEIPYERTRLTLLQVADITEKHRKTEELTAAQDRLTALNQRLERYNREIVAYTAENEALQAKMKIHDELGLSLLSIKYCLLKQDGGASEAEIVDRLRQNIRFLKFNTPPAPLEDEYTLMIGNAEKLGVRVLVEGALPEAPHIKHVIANAIHECFTNTLRHAHGDELRLSIREEGGRVVAVFSNNGAQPTKEIREKGGLASLRRLTESMGGEMTVQSLPGFALILNLPKEDAYGL